MYTFNIYVYGHDFSQNKELNNGLSEIYDMEFTDKVILKGREVEFEVDFPYHGGQVAGDVYSCVFGYVITDDDVYEPKGRASYINDIKNFNENTYYDHYMVFVDHFKKEFEEIITELDQDPRFKQTKKDKEFNQEFKKKLFDFLDNTQPTLYSVEASS